MRVLLAIASLMFTLPMMAQVPTYNLNASGVALGTVVCADTSGSGTAQTCTTSPSFTITTNSCLVYTTTTTNSGTGLTVNINSLGAKSIAIPGSSGWTTTLTASTIPTGAPLHICYNGTNWNVQQTGISSSGGGSGFGSIGSGTNISAAMIVGSGATLTPTGSGSIQSTQLGADLDCTKFSSSGDMSQAIASCLTALHSISAIGGIADATGFTGNQTWSINPFAGQTPGTTIPWTGELRVCTTGTITLDVPIVQANYWRIVGCGTAQGAGSKSAAFTANTGTFQATYTTGTITVGTPGQGEVITGSGTTWTSSMVGCAFVSPSSQPTLSNSTYGIIHSVGSATSITLGYGANNGTGAPSSSNYAIYCPMVLMGGDASGAGSPPAQYTGIDEHLSLNCNNIAGCVDVMNWYGEEGTELVDATLTGYTNIGYDIETNFAQNSSPGRLVILQPGSSCTSSTISFENRTHAVATKPFKDSSINNPFCSTNPNVGLDIQGSNIRLENLHVENYVTAISVSNNTSCPVACATPPTQSVGFSAEHINAAASGTNVISLGSTGGSLDGAHLSDITVSAGATWTNVLSDSSDSCTDTATRIGDYLIRVNGGIQQSTSTTSSCQANLVAASGTFGSGTGNAITMPETTPGSCTSANDIIAANSSTHTAQLCNNGGTAFNIAQTVASGTAAMGTSAISSGTCATVVTVSATGVASTDSIIYTPNSDPTGVTGYAVSSSGSLYIWAYPTANNVNFKVCNNTSGSITPSALTLNWRVAR